MSCSPAVGPAQPLYGPDTLVPPAMGRYLAAQLPRCHARMLPGEGHLLIIDRMPDLIEALRPLTPPPS